MRNFFCAICQISFGTKHVLRMHMETHKPQADRYSKFSCPHCGKVKITNRVIHIERVWSFKGQYVAIEIEGTTIESAFQTVTYFLNFYKQEYIPVGCVPPAAVSVVRCLHQAPPQSRHPPPGSRQPPGADNPPLEQTPLPQL